MQFNNYTYLFDKVPNLQVKDFLMTTEFIEQFRSQIGERLGAGGAGEVYEIVDQEYVVKVSDPCKYRRNPTIRAIDAIKTYCNQMIEQNSITVIPHEDKSLILLPNFLSEGLIAGYITSLIEDKYTLHFARHMGIYISPIELRTYLIVEKLMADVQNVINQKSDVYLMLFQIAQGLSVAQETYRFTHYDLHGENILYELSDPNIEYYGYPIPTNNGIVKIYIRNAGYLIKITDFGLSRMETNKAIINPRVDTFPVVSHGLFHPFYDFISFLGSLLINTNMPLSQKFNSLLSISEKTELLSFILKEQRPTGYSDEQFLNLLVLRHYSQNTQGQIIWRPAKLQEVIYENVSNVYDILIWLSKKLIGIQMGQINVPDEAKIQEIQQLDRYILQKYLYSTSGITLGPLNDTTRTIIDDGIQLFSGYVYNINPLKSYNLTPSKRYVETCPFQTTYNHVVFIDTKAAFDKGYSFKFDCCKIDPIEYMRDKIGVVINGGFFDIKNTYQPIGPYRQVNGNKFYETNLQIPELYRQYFALISIYKGELKFNLMNDIDNIQVSEADYVLASGPILVWEGQQVFDENMVETTQVINNITTKIFQCTSSRNTSKLVQLNSRTNYTLEDNKCMSQTVPDSSVVANCDNIDPGELSHAGNPNPRSMIIFRNNDDGLGDIALVVVEGRTDRGDGMDLVQLSRLAMGLKAIYAVNLDGGRSSNIAWRTGGNVVYNVNPSRQYRYPVGNVISLIY